MDGDGFDCECVALVVLKRVLNQVRLVAGLMSDPGMPYSHTQSIFFTVVFTIASILEWQGINEFSVSISVLALAFRSYFSWFRVSQQLHTINQIIVGAVVGSIFSILWYISCDAVVLEAFN
ncbi:Lipid phosphate phosphatase epsilon 2 [Hibiscus syriacus]|uniref:Lipid phosphate phosphatase epsilon 2 n=1 Tax=Hibiscus syriacus TaxID=106335 RepID=A0A6A2Y007_HIBSY|nr:Lipid phosphate phosphatase epsilon 2 [Hibiscus syriacus]